jgi:hypothetical protein
MKDITSPHTGRTKKRFNAYLAHDLVSFGENYAKAAFKSAKKPEGESLSFLVEHLLKKLKAKEARKADKIAKIRAGRRS